MNYKEIILPLVVLLFFLGCAKQPEKAQTDDSYKLFVYDLPENDNEIIMSSCNIICKDKNQKPISFGDTGFFHVITKPVFTYSHVIFDGFIKYKSASDSSPKTFLISIFFLLYDGFSKDV